jgi:Protein of unknown function (DUF3987)
MTILHGNFKPSAVPPAGPDPWPDLSQPERPEDRVPGRFPLDVLPGKAARFIAFVADDLCGPPEFAAIGCLAVAGALAGSNVAVRPKEHAAWLEHANLWTMGLGEPGVLEKTPMFHAVMAPVWQIQNEKRQRWLDEYKAWRARNEKRKKGEPVEEPPMKPIIVLQDTTREAMGDAMLNSPQTLIGQDELSDMILNMSRYTNGSDREFYLAAWTCKPHSINRIQRGWIVVPRTFLAVYGFTQPDVARLCFQIDAKHVDDGLLDRFGLVAVPDPGDYMDYRWRDQPTKGIDPRDEWRALCQAIDQGAWKMQIPYRKEAQDDTHIIKLSPEARTTFGAFVEGIKRWQRNPKNKQRCPYHGQVCKAPATVMRTALVLHVMLHCSGETTNPAVLTLDSIERAVTIYQEFAEPHYVRLLGAMLDAREQSDADRIEDWLRRKPRRATMQFSDVQRAKISKTLQDRNAHQRARCAVRPRGIEGRPQRPGLPRLPFQVRL